MDWGNGGTVISSWKCNFSIYLDIQIYYLDIQAMTTLLCLLLVLYVLVPSIHSFFYVTTTLVERMDDYRMARRVLMAEVSMGWVRGRLRLGWMDGVKVALGNRGMTVEAERQCAKDRKAWRSVVHM